MKKIIMCLVLIFTMCIPAFAESKNVVYSSDYKFVAGNSCVYGVTLINNKIYIPLQSLKFKRDETFDDHGNIIDCFYINTTKNPSDASKFVPDGDNIHISASHDSKIYGGRYIGEAELSPKKLRVDYNAEDAEGKTQVQTKEYENVVYTLGGMYPMISLEVFKDIFPKLTIDTTAKIIDLNLPSSGYTECDLAADAMEKFYDNNASEKNRVMSIHDFVVQKLFYGFHYVKGGFPYSDFGPRDGVREKIDAAWEKYEIKTNVIFEAGTGVCEEYENLFRQMCTIAGIPCLKVDGVNHTWNCVYIDGKWQFVDCTLDDPNSQPNSSLVKYNYFLIAPEKYKNSYSGSMEYTIAFSNHISVF